MNIPSKSKSILGTLELPFIDPETKEPFNRDKYDGSYIIRYRNGYPEDTRDGMPAIERVDGVVHYEHIINQVIHQDHFPAIVHYTETGIIKEYWTNGLLVRVVEHEDAEVTELSDKA